MDEKIHTMVFEVAAANHEALTAHLLLHRQLSRDLAMMVMQ